MKRFLIVFAILLTNSYLQAQPTPPPSYMCLHGPPTLCKAVRGFPVAHDEDYIHEFHRKYPERYSR